MDRYELKPCDVEECPVEGIPLCRLVCAKCGYDLRANSLSTRCSECGTVQCGADKRVAWWRLWIPSAGPINRFWATGVDGRSVSVPLGACLLIAVLAMGAFGWMTSAELWRTEWVFASSEPAEPIVVLDIETDPMPQYDGILSMRTVPNSPTLKNSGNIESEFSFGSRNYFRGFLGSMAGSSGGRSSPGIRSIYWKESLLTGSTLVVPDRLTVREHYVEQRRLWPPAWRMITSSVSFGLFPLGVLIALSIAGPLLSNAFGRGLYFCSAGMYAGWRQVTRAVLIGMAIVGGFGTLMTLNPLNVVYRNPELVRLIGQVVFFVIFIGPVWVALCGLRRDVARRMIARRFAMVGMVFVIYLLIVVCAMIVPSRLHRLIG